MKYLFAFFAICFCSPVHAADGGVIDFAPLISEIVVPIAAGVISGVIWALLKRVGLEIDRRVLLDAVEAKAREVVAKKGPMTIGGVSEETASITNYVMQRAPEAARRLGLTVKDEHGAISASGALGRIIETRIVGAALGSSEDTGQQKA